MPHNSKSGRSATSSRLGRALRGGARKLRERFLPSGRLPAPPPQFQGPVPQTPRFTPQPNFQPATGGAPTFEPPPGIPGVNLTPALPQGIPGVNFTPANRNAPSQSPSPSAPPPQGGTTVTSPFANIGSGVFPGFESAARFDERGNVQDPLSVADIGLLGAKFGPAAGPGVASGGLIGTAAQQAAQRAQRAAGINIGRNLEREAARAAATERIPQSLDDLISSFPASRELAKAEQGNIFSQIPFKPVMHTKNQKRFLDAIRDRIGLNQVKTITTTSPETGRVTVKIIEEQRRLNAESISKFIFVTATSFGFAKFLQQEAIQQIGLAHKTAKDDNDIEGMQAADEVNEQLLKNSGWKHAVDIVPGVGIARAVLQDFIPAAIVKHENDKKATAKAEKEFQFQQAEGLFTPIEQSFTDQRIDTELAVQDVKRDFTAEENALFDQRRKEQREQDLLDEGDREARKARYEEEAQDRFNERALEAALERDRLTGEQFTARQSERDQFNAAVERGFKGTFEDFKKSTLKFGLLR